MNWINLVIRILKRDAFYPLILLFIGLISYFFTSPALGFYWDDWQAVFLYKANSAELIRQFFQYDRPFSAWTYEITFNLLPMTPVAWQLLSILIRTLATWLFVLTFSRIWISQAQLMRWFGAILLVFPGFTLQSISVAFNQHFITLLLYSASIYTMVRAIQTKAWTKWGWLAVSLISAVLHMFTMEYFVGLELVRPLICWFVIRNEDLDKRNFKANIKKTILYFVPYLVIFVGFGYWRLAIYPDQLLSSPMAEDPNAPVILQQLFQTPQKTLINFANLVLQDILFLLTQSWSRIISTDSIRFDAGFNLLSWFVGLVTALLFRYRFKEPIHHDDQVDHQRFAWQSLAMGLMIVFWGGLAIWVTGRQILVGKWSDRFVLAPMIGATLLFVLLVDWAIRTRRQKMVILVLVLGLSIAFQMRTTHKYALDWNNQRGLYWQLNWRIPAVKPGTAFFSGGVPSTYSSDFSAGFVTNILYGGEQQTEELTHWFFTPSDTGFNFYKLAPDYEIVYKFRNIYFNGSTSNALAYMYKPASGCLVLLSPAYDGNPAMDENNRMLIPLTNYAQVDLDAKSVVPDARIFGEEPPHDWCYYFQKADLYRQQSDWQSVLITMQEAHSAGLEEKSAVERLPELEAHFHLQQWDSFVDIGNHMINGGEKMDRFVCKQLERLNTEFPGILPADIEEQIDPDLECLDLLSE